MPPTRSVLHSRVTPALVQRIFRPLKDAIPHARFFRRADHRRRKLDAASIVVALVFFHMRRLSSLRALVDAFQAVPSIGRVLQLAPIQRSTLSDALSCRQKSQPDPRLRDFVQDLLHSVALKASRVLGKKRSTAGAFLAVDGSVFSATAKMLFARLDDQHNALKTHVALDIQSHLPRFLKLSNATASEISQLHENVTRGVTYIVDRGYFDFKLFHSIKNKGAWFVTRMKRRVICKVEKNLTILSDERADGVLEDQIVRLDDGRLRLRRVVFRADDGRVFDYLTNHTSLTAREIADLYKSRWAVETFFKFLKHSLSTLHLISRTLLGFHIQLLAAAIAYLLLAIHMGPHASGRPPVTLTGMRCLVDQMLAEIIRAAPPNGPTGLSQGPCGDPAITIATSGST